jgi:Fur family transcriptional regulator, ferric uptake regulator
MPDRHSPTASPSFVAALERSGHRVTEPRTLVADLIANQDGHFTAADLLDRARDRRLRLGRATVFRALELFTELGALERIDLPSGEHAYVICEPAEHHHHVVCSRCGRSTEVQDAGLQGVVDEIARRTGYQIDTHRLELFGLCPTCHRSST